MLVTEAVDGTGYVSPVGLLFAGNSSGTFAIANDIDAVLSRFGVTIDGAVAATGSVSGNVTNAEGGSPIQGATVSVDTGQSADTDENGDYTISGVPTGDRSVTASGAGFYSETTAATVNENPPRLTRRRRSRSGRRERRRDPRLPSDRSRRESDPSRSPTRLRRAARKEQRQRWPRSERVSWRFSLCPRGIAQAPSDRMSCGYAASAMERIERSPTAS